MLSITNTTFPPSEYDKHNMMIEVGNSSFFSEFNISCSVMLLQIVKLCNNNERDPSLTPGNAALPVKFHRSTFVKSK